MTTLRRGMTLILAAAALAPGPGVTATEVPAGRPILFCRFGEGCDTDRACDGAAVSVNHDPATGAYWLTAAGTGRSDRATLTRMDRLLVFDTSAESDSPQPQSWVNRMTVAPDGAAAIQHALYIEARPGKWRLLAESLTGHCSEDDG